MIAEEYRARIETARRANLANVSPPPAAVIKAPIVARKWGEDSFLTRVEADLVRSGEPNRNGALWTKEDLEFGLSSLAFKPINFAHISTRVCGVIEEAEIALLEGTADYVIKVKGQLWDWVQFEDVIDTRSYSEVDEAYCSMECYPSAIQCLGERGCNETFDYLDVVEGNCCVHILDRSSIRRMVDPLFIGMAIVLPPTMPGWADAVLKVRKPF